MDKIKEKMFEIKEVLLMLTTTICNFPQENYYA